MVRPVPHAAVVARANVALIAVVLLLIAWGRDASAQSTGPRPVAPRSTSASASHSGRPASAPAAPFVVPQWAFPTAPPPNPLPVPDSVTPHRVPGARRSFTFAQTLNRYAVADWFPDSHPPMPIAVRSGRAPQPMACGHCHLPDGRGRPENAAISGLPAPYIVAQVKAFADKSRLAANPSSSTNTMHLVAAAVSDDALEEAARYFSAIPFVSRNRVREVDVVPRTRIATILYVRDGDAQEPIAGRLIEMPEDFERHELHDPTVRYVTYVPRGSLTRGRRIVTKGPDGPATACATCHGPDLQGVGLVPGIAGRPPSYLLRQLLNIRSGARHDAATVPMQAVVAKMSVDDMVGVAAWLGRLGESRR